jgi:hypothetical protein
MKRSMMLLAATLFVMACDKPAEQKPDDPASKNATTTGAQSAQTAATPTPAPVTIADSDLATPADFEEAAEKSITKASYKTELASLETELGKE